MEPNVIPAPVALAVQDGHFVLAPGCVLTAPEGPAGRFLAALLRRATGYELPFGPDGAVTLSLDGPETLGDEGYHLEVTPSEVRLRARTDRGLFWGVQTLRQLLPAEIEGDGIVGVGWNVPCVRIEDEPRYAWRGAMLDLARHFFDAGAVRRFIDRLVPYKINVLHLHLTDDQGWRLEIKARPRLTTVGAATQVGGGPGGHLTQDDYAAIVAYAAERYITVVPEIDVPGHTQAAMAAYPELAPSRPVDGPLAARLLAEDGTTPVVYTGTEVGFSELAIDQDGTYAFLAEVVAETAALTPGPYLHLGGDEALKTTAEDYAAFMARALPLPAAHGKTVVAWQEAAASPALPPGARLQYWRPGSEPVPAAVKAAAASGAVFVMSPADRAYLDAKYDESSPLGLTWAGTLSVRRSYEWDPATLLEDAEIAGVEAPLWSETLLTPDDLDHMLYPRLPGLAEVAWSPPARDWPAYRARLRAHVPRWDAAGVAYYASPELD